MPGMSFENGLALWSLISQFVSIFAWPVTVCFIAIYYRSSFETLLKSVRRAELPWGAGSVEFENEAARLKAESIEPDPDRPQNRPAEFDSGFIDYNKLQVDRGLSPVSSGLSLRYYRGIAKDDPALSLLALRMDLEVIVKNMLKGSEIEFDHKFNLHRALRALLSHGKITPHQFEVTQGVIDFCNRAAHGSEVNALMAEPIIKDYKAWLNWNFER